jgi:glycosyltransferase involved in cell wall biosynthesis
VGLESVGTRPGGLNRYLADLVVAERGIGIDASAIVLGDEPELDGPREGVSVVGRATGPMILRSSAIDRAVRGLGPIDVADVHFAAHALVAITIGSLRRTPVIVHFQGPWADESAASGASHANVRAKRAVERAVYRRASACITLSASFAQILERTYGIAPWSITVIPPGVDLERFSPGEAAGARARLGIDAEHVVLAVRRLVPRMGLDVLIRGWAASGPRATDLLAVVGDGPELAGLRELARALGVARTVRFAGRATDAELADWYRAADTTVVPSVALEGFGLVVLESLACGTPVIGTDAGGLKEAIVSLGQGPAVRAGDVEGLADRLLVARSGPKSAATVATCRAIAEAHGWDAVARSHERIYERAIEGDDRLRVVVLDHTAVLSGGELAIARALGAVRDAAHVHVILADDGSLRSRLEASGATVEVATLASSARTLRSERVTAAGLSPGAVLEVARYVVWLARRLRALRPDVVHTNSLKAALYGGAAARLAGVPCVWHVRDRIESPPLSATAVRLVRTAARVLPTAVVANSASTLASVHVVDGTVLASPLDPSIRPRDRSAPHEGPLRVVTVGRLAPWKGQHIVLEAFAAAFPTDGAVLSVVGSPLFGEDDYAASLPAHAARLGVADRTVFTGFVDDVAQVLSDADVFVHASVRAEPFGQVVVEAMGAGLAVVAANAGGPAEVITQGTDGLLFAPGDVDALAGCLRLLGSDPALRDRLGRAATQSAARFRPEMLAPALLSVWQRAADTRRRRFGAKARGPR